MGGCGVGELESGTTTTLRRSSLTVSRLSTTHGRVLAISEPSTGSKATHQTSPRRGIDPGLFDFILHAVPFSFENSCFPVLIRCYASSSERCFFFSQALLQGTRQEARTFAGGDPFHQRASELLRQGESHLSGGHTTILARHFFKPVCQLSTTVSGGALAPPGITGTRNRWPSLLTS